MSDFVLTTARPPKAAIAWASSDAIFVEIPCVKGGPPFIVRQRKSISGLAAALNILIEHSEPQLVRQDTLNKDHPAITVVKAPKGSATWATDQQREATREILRKLGKIE